jgi:hypothetical protein
MKPLTQILSRRFEGRVTALALMSLGLIERVEGGWRLTATGRDVFFA